MKKFLKVLGKYGEDFLYLHIKFPNRSDDKCNQDTFVGLQIGKGLFDDNFATTFNYTELNAWKSIKLFFLCFLDNKKQENYAEIIKILVQKYSY